jgi:hypothetical protein
MRQAWFRVEALAKRVDGAGSDVAEDDAERCDNEAAAAGWGILVVLNHLVGRAACHEGLWISSPGKAPRMIGHSLPPLSDVQML